MQPNNPLVPRPIPYEAIDIEVRRLVQLLNEIPGIRTTESCAGHEVQVPQTTVTFLAENQCALCRVMKCLPFVGSRGRFLDRPILESIYVTVEMGHARRMTYKLRVTGSPHYVQRELIGQVEQTMLMMLAEPGTHLACSACE